MSPIKHRKGGRGFQGAFDDQRTERFNPGLRGESFGANVLSSRGIQASMTPNSLKTTVRVSPEA